MIQIFKNNSFGYSPDWLGSNILVFELGCHCPRPAYQREEGQLSVKRNVDYDKEILYGMRWKLFKRGRGTGEGQEAEISWQGETGPGKIVFKGLEKNGWTVPYSLLIYIPLTGRK